MTGVPYEEWRSRAEKIDPYTDHHIDGAFSPGAGTLPVVAPRDGRTIARVAAADAADVDRAVAAARRAFDEGPWPRLAPAERKAALLRWADLVERDREHLSLLVSLEMGKPIGEAYGIELRAVAGCLRWYAEVADKQLDEVPRTGDDALALITREPAGVVAAVVPWNFPLTMAAWKLAPALAVGCTVVLKPAEESPLSALHLAALATEAGLPPGAFNVVNGRGEVAGRALGEHPGVDVVAFTGSGEVGRHFLRYAAASNLKRVWLELGGKSPNIILPDAPDLDAAADTAAWGIFFNAGEMCSAPSRLLVHRSVAERVLDRIVARAGKIRVGDPLDPATEMGPLVSARHREQVLSYVEAGRADGARLRAGGEVPDGDGHFLRPTVFDRVGPGMRIAREEIFGPVLAVQEFDDADEAVRLANDTEYGLAAAVWTSDLSAAHRISRALRAGVVWVNCYEEGDMSVPFGGMKQSGHGRDKSLHALDKYTDLKTTWIAL
ncbi:aldehyde dehydrogenase [Actinomadura viridis]|uniref:Gamma-glutamyl-gamma-aminobutyraldehyde dehydrogenase n=1 Tax=Actinomadura viridis TaxID=58110 RepID=A0A931DI12_9ACTN|nr:aldehyde dehydrogenase family protein [Actinomadura viridis]MBG6091559.1 gamma-glutamyl-gamma-aminobutyraldehyde dehydrogenase [Actinomadura viridis]